MLKLATRCQDTARDVLWSGLTRTSDGLVGPVGEVGGGEPLALAVAELLVADSSWAFLAILTHFMANQWTSMLAFSGERQ